MDQNTSLAVQPMPRSLLQMSDGQMNKLMLLAEMISQSKLAIGKNGRETLTKADAFMILLKGISLGMNEMAALESIDLISGKPAVDGQGMLGLCYASDELEDIQIVATNEKCSVTMKRKGKTAHTEIFGVEEASRYMTSEWSNGSKKTIPLIEKDNYKSQPRTMFKWRAIAACARVVFPDKVQGLYTKEELGANVAVTEDGAMTVQESPALPAPKPPQPAAVQIPATTPETVVEPPQKPATPIVEAAPVTSPKAYTLPSLYNAVLKDVYSNNNFHMKNSIALLIKNGTLTPEMTLDEAIAVVKNRPSDYKQDTDENEKIIVDTPPVSTDPEPSRLAELNNEELLITRIEPRADSKGWYGYGPFDGIEVRVNIFAPEDPKMIEEANHDWTGKVGVVAYPVILKEDRGMLRIASVKPKRGKSPFGKVDPESQALHDALPTP